MNERLSIDICICTFRRDHILTTLTSLGQLNILQNWTVRIIVADNDDRPSAKEQINAIAPDLPFPVMYIHAPARNISIARNACLTAATGDYIAFIDDDEIASPQWLKELVETALNQKSDAVLGPVDPVIPEYFPFWIRQGKFHETRPVWVKGNIITGYTCNLLLNRHSPPFQGLQFRTELGRTGGEDTVFLSTLHQRGGKISYAENALLTEPVPENRASLLWLLKRRFRSGQTHALLICDGQKNSLIHRIGNMIKAFIKFLACAGLAIICIPAPVKSIGWLLRGALHCGVIAGLSGQKGLIQYG